VHNVDGRQAKSEVQGVRWGLRWPKSLGAEKCFDLVTKKHIEGKLQMSRERVLQPVGVVTAKKYENQNMC